MFHDSGSHNFRCCGIEISTGKGQPWKALTRLLCVFALSALTVRHAAAQTPPVEESTEAYSVELWGAFGYPADDTVEIQAALDFAKTTPCVLFFPAKRYLVYNTLNIENPGTTRASAPVLRGRGAEATTIEYRGTVGPLFKVVGVKQAGQFLCDLAFERLKLSAINGSGTQHGLQMMGCYAPSIKNVTITGFSGDAVRVVGAPEIHSNPDFSSTNFLSIDGCTISRVGGYGFLDDHPIGCPGLSIERSIFTMCGTGGIKVRSASFAIERTAIASSGWRGESLPVNASAIGLQILTPGATVSRGLVRACEFDNNRAEHLRMDNFSMARFENNRFIYGTVMGGTVLTPPLGAHMASLGSASALSQIVFDGLFHRIDKPGTAVGMKWSGSLNVDETSIEVVRTRVTNAPGAAFTEVVGAP